MGNRGRASSRKIRELAAMKNSADKKLFTRNKALNALTVDNCTETRFTNHPNKHVKVRAARLAGVAVSDDDKTSVS